MNKREGSTKTFININKNKEQEIMRKATILILIAVLAFSSVAMAADKRASGSKKTYRDTDAVNIERVVKNSTGVALNKTAGFVVADTMQIGKSSYDYGWNAPARTLVTRDAAGNIHVAYINRELTDNSDRQVSYVYIVGGVRTGSGNVTGEGDLAYMPTVRTYQDGRAAISLRLRGTSPAGTKDFFVDQLAGFAIFVGKVGAGGDGTLDAFPQFAMGSDQRAWWASANLTTINPGKYSDDEGATWISSAANAWDMSGAAGWWTGTGVETTADGGSVAYWQYFDGAPNAAGDTVTTLPTNIANPAN